MNIQNVFFADIFFHLANRFQKRLAFDIADRAADFGDNYVGIDFLTDAEHLFFDRVRHMRNDLNGPAQVIAFTFPRNDGLINATARHIGTLT